MSLQGYGATVLPSTSLATKSGAGCYLCDVHTSNLTQKCGSPKYRLCLYWQQADSSCVSILIKQVQDGPRLSADCGHHLVKEHDSWYGGMQRDVAATVCCSNNSAVAQVARANFQNFLGPATLSCLCPCICRCHCLYR